MKDILLDINGLTKAYPGVVANNNVSFQIRRGEVHALLGENGAGKSTLVKMIYGLVKPDSGSMTFQDQQFIVFFWRPFAFFYVNNLLLRLILQCLQDSLLSQLDCTW